MRASAGKRVLMLVENLPYPHDLRVRQEATALKTAGYSVAVIAQRGRGQTWRECVNGVSVYRYPAPPPAAGLFSYAFEYAYSLAAMFLLSVYVSLQHGFDVIHAANPPDTAVFIAGFFKLFGKRFVFDHHDLAPEMYAVRFGSRGPAFVSQALEWLERLSCQTADQIIATNQSYRAVEMQRGHAPAARITVVRNGPALDRLRLVAPDPGLRQKAGVIIGYVGNIALQDGLDYLLRALAHLRHDLGRTDFFCVVIGKGDALASLQALATELGLDDHVWFTGYVSDADLIRYLSTADICVDPDPSNAFNDRCTMIKMMEYMALSKPIVAFDLPEHRVTAQCAAAYARSNDELDFARQLAALMDDPERRRQMGLFGRRRVETELAWLHQQKQLLEAYQAVRGLPLRPPGIAHPD